MTYPSASVAQTRALGGGWFVTGGGDLYFRDSKVATGVLSVSDAYPGWYWHNGVSYSTAAGTFHADLGTVVGSYGAVPAGSTSVGGLLPGTER